MFWKRLKNLIAGTLVIALCLTTAMMMSASATSTVTDSTSETPSADMMLGNG